MSNLCETWFLIRKIDNQEPGLVGIIIAILCALFQPYIDECVQLPFWMDDDKYTSVNFPGLHLRTKTMIFLLEFGVSPNYYNSDGRVPIHYASEQFCHDIVKILVDYGADLTLCDKPMTKEEIEQDKKDEPCEYHSQRRWRKMNSGSTPLHLVVRDCKNDNYEQDTNTYGQETMKVLLNKDTSSIYIKNDLGITPWDMVQGSKFMDPIMDDYM